MTIYLDNGDSTLYVTENGKDFHLLLMPPANHLTGNDDELEEILSNHGCRPGSRFT